VLKLFFAPHTCALASHIALIDVGAEFETVRIDFRAEEQRKSDQGILTETPAILVFIAQSYPGAGLAPIAEPFAFARVQAFNNFICSTLHVAHAHRMRGSRWADDPAAIEAMQRKVPQSVGDAYALIERHWFDGPWVTGRDYTVCDPYLFTLAQWMEGDGVDPARFPKIADHRRRMADRSGVKQALAEELGPA
jgi:glutathione S-transferase